MCASLRCWRILYARDLRLSCYWIFLDPLKEFFNSRTIVDVVLSSLFGLLYKFCCFSYPTWDVRCVLIEYIFHWSSFEIHTVEHVKTRLTCWFVLDKIEGLLVLKYLFCFGLDQSCDTWSRKSQRSFHMAAVDKFEDFSDDSGYRCYTVWCWLTIIILNVNPWFSKSSINYMIPSDGTLFYKQVTILIIAKWRHNL